MVAIGETLSGTYRISELVGGGAFADVYLGRVLRTNTVVALKILHPHFGRDPAVVQRSFQKPAPPTLSPTPTSFVPTTLERTVAQGLEKIPAKRFQTAAQFPTRIERLA